MTIALKMLFTVQLVLLLLGFLVTSHVQAIPKRIIGGDVFGEEGQFPFVVAVRDRDNDAKKSFCTGSIIAERFVVTAAHCVVLYGDSFRPENIQVVAGVHDLNIEFSQRRVVVDVVEMFVPTEYHSTSRERSTGDIAVLKLKEDLGIAKNPNLGKINLPMSDTTYAGVEATIIGFGWNEITKSVLYPAIPGLESLEGTGDGKLRYAKATVFEHAECMRLYVQDIQPEIVKKHICAQMEQRDPENVEGVCAGDSGGPLVYNDVLIGVVNTSPVTCREDVKPSVYGRVTEFVDFINKVLSGNIDETIRSSKA